VTATPAPNRDLGSANGLRLGRACLRCRLLDMRDEREWVAWAWTSTETGRTTPRSGPAWASASPWAKTSKTSTQPITATATPRAMRRSARGWAAIPRASTPASATLPPRAATRPAADQPARGSLARDNCGGDGADHCSRSVVPGRCSNRLGDPCSTWLIGPTHRPRKQGSESSRSSANHRGLACSWLWTAACRDIVLWCPRASPGSPLGRRRLVLMVWSS